jgi:hypothetical protein
MSTTYHDRCTDLQGRTWQINDRILHRIPGVRSDVGKVTEIYCQIGAVRVRVTFDDGGMAPVYLSECTLIRRRTDDEIPYCAMEGGS